MRLLNKKIHIFIVTGELDEKFTFAYHVQLLYTNNPFL